MTRSISVFKYLQFKYRNTAMSVCISGSLFIFQCAISEILSASMRTGSALSGRVSTVSPGPHENPDQLIVLAPAHPGLLLLLILTSDAFQQSCQ